MTSDKVLDKLSARGYTIHVHSPYHVHIVVEGLKHNLYFNKFDQMSLFLAGTDGAERISNVNELLKKLDKYSSTNTRLAKMQQVVSLMHFASGTTKKGIFVDAGFKNGHAKIALVWISQDGVDIRIRERETKTSLDAEVFAVASALDWSIGQDVTIFSDCQGAVEIVHMSRVQWLPREQNKTADAFANLRGKKNAKV